MLRIKEDSLAETRGRFRQAVLPSADRAQVVVRVGEIRLESKRLLEAVGRLLQPFLLLERLAQVVVSVDQLGQKLDCPPQTVGGLFGLS